MPTIEDLTLLLQNPSENLSIEYKSWLDVRDNAGRANLAKAAIALANEGGGIIVLGMREDAANGGALGSQPRPLAIPRYSQDGINAAIERFADPPFHCELMEATHPDTGIRHAFVVVPGGMTIPVMSIRGCEGVIQPQRCYVRKPGPRSEEPYTAEEWRSVMERCLQARRESMLEAIRVIVHGHGSPPAAVEQHGLLNDFVRSARERWSELTADLPQNDPARMPQGHYELEFEILGAFDAPSLNELRGRLEEASRIKHTGWGPFVSLTRPPFDPRPVAGNVEAWIGAAGEPRFLRTPAHCDFWRANPKGLFLLLRGFDEDSFDGVESGNFIDVTLPVWRVAEAILYLARLSRSFGDNLRIFVRLSYTGLRGRRLTALSPGRLLFGDYTCADQNFGGETRARANDIADNLVEIIHPLLVPLYERFSFYSLSIEFVRQEIERLRRGRF